MNAQAGKSDDALPYPIIADKDRTMAVALGMIDPMEKDAQGLPLTARAVFIVSPDKKLKLSILYPATTGRNFEWVTIRIADIFHDFLAYSLTYLAAQASTFAMLNPFE